jgi:plasmid stabilization system protein ParE
MMKFAGRFGAALACSTALIPVTAYAQDAAAEEESLIKHHYRDGDTPRREYWNAIAVTAIQPGQRKAGRSKRQNIHIGFFFSTRTRSVVGTVVLRIRGIGTTSNIGFESAVGHFRRWLAPIPALLSANSSM